MSLIAKGWHKSKQNWLLKYWFICLCLLGARWRASRPRLRAVGELSASGHTHRTYRSRSHWIEDREEADHATKQSKVRPGKLRLDEGLRCGNAGLCLAERRAQGCILVPGSWSTSNELAHAFLHVEAAIGGRTRRGHVAGAASHPRTWAPVLWINVNQPEAKAARKNQEHNDAAQEQGRRRLYLGWVGSLDPLRCSWEMRLGMLL
jgi:hypothetical protein